MTPYRYRNWAISKIFSIRIQSLSSRKATNSRVAPLRGATLIDWLLSSKFSELEKIFYKYHLHSKLYLIFNKYEEDITHCHTPPSVVAMQDIHPLAVTAGMSCTTTTIGCGSASGMAVSPYYVFVPKRILQDLMKGNSPGAASWLSDSFWSNSEIFRRYMSDHFLKFAPDRDDQHILLLLYGHKHMCILVWLSGTNLIILYYSSFQPHTSHIFHSMDVGSYGPFQRMYNAESNTFTLKFSCTITQYDVCDLASKVYSMAPSSENLQSAFKKTSSPPPPFFYDVLTV